MDTEAKLLELEKRVVTLEGSRLREGLLRLGAIERLPHENVDRDRTPIDFSHVGGKRVG